MIPRFLLCFCTIASTGAMAQTALYEEDLLASASIRVEQWKQMQAYTAALLKKTLPVPKEATTDREVLARSFRESIGYPPPGFVDHPSGHFDKVGEDSTATYYRCFIRVTPEMETYGLYIVPKNVKLPAPLVISQHGGGRSPRTNRRVTQRRAEFLSN